MTQAQMEQRIKQWTGDKTADYGALCNDVAQLKLQKVNALPKVAGSNICRNVWLDGALPQWLGGVTSQPKFTVITVNPGK